jgi:hypothetical protein
MYNIKKLFYSLRLLLYLIIHILFNSIQQCIFFPDWFPAQQEVFHFPLAYISTLGADSFLFDEYQEHFSEINMAGT